MLTNFAVQTAPTCLAALAFHFSEGLSTSQISDSYAFVCVKMFHKRHTFNIGCKLPTK